MEVHGGFLTVESLAGGAVAVFGVERLFAAQLVFDFTAVAAGVVAGMEIFVAVDFVGFAVFPGVEFAFCGA